MTVIADPRITGYCPTGWTPLVTALIKDLAMLEGVVEINSVKNNNGVLAINTTGATDEMQLLINQCCMQTEEICQFCGMPGEVKVVTEKNYIVCQRHETQLLSRA